jgi:hypothetical protein
MKKTNKNNFNDLAPVKNIHKFTGLYDVQFDDENMQPMGHGGLLHYIKNFGTEIMYDGPAITEDIDYELIEQKQLNQ